MTSLAEVVAAGAARLRDAGVDGAEGDAGVLARHLLGWSLADWVTRRDRPADGGFAESFARLIHRRVEREPVAYLMGVKEFFGRPFQVRPGVLIPRPETELVVEAAVAAIQGVHVPRLLDVGTGSGCIAITLALEVPDAVVTATDLSQDALAVAAENARALGGSVVFELTDLFPAAGGPWHAIAANPPYVPDSDRHTLARDILDFEPALALFAGPDGLDAVGRIIEGAARRLEPGGALILEVGHDQSGKVTTLLRAGGFGAVDWRPDLQGIPRVVTARKGFG